MYDKLISLDNLFLSWDEFKKGKINKLDVLMFERHLEDNIFSLYDDLKNFNYRHGPYTTFHIFDPKHRIISKASVRDRLVHHLVFKELDNIFDGGFFYHSYASRKNKGTHLAVLNLFSCLRKVSKNYHHNTYILKCDVKKFFHSVSHQKLLALKKRKVKDNRFLWLIEEIINSFSKEHNSKIRGLKGLPIGNITSQIFANIYLNQLDWFVKRDLKIKHYFRYADDFVIIHADPAYLTVIAEKIQVFLRAELDLELHPNKVFIRKLNQGIDFLGYVILPHYLVLRTKTKQRMFRKIKQNKKKLASGLISQETFNQSIQSYLGILKHCRGHKLARKVMAFTHHS